jgi:hypothetical protein
MGKALDFVETEEVFNNYFIFILWLFSLFFTFLPEGEEKMKRRGLEMRPSVCAWRKVYSCNKHTYMIYTTVVGIEAMKLLNCYQRNPFFKQK